jgi:hypothetical protein
MTADQYRKLARRLDGLEVLLRRHGELLGAMADVLNGVRRHLAARAHADRMLDGLKLVCPPPPAPGEDHP